MCGSDAPAGASVRGPYGDVMTTFPFASGPTGQAGVDVWAGAARAPAAPTIAPMIEPGAGVAVDGLPRLWITRAAAVALRTCRITTILRIIPHVCIEVQIVLVPDGVSLQEPSDLRIIDARLVVIEPKLRQRGLAGVAETPA